MNRDYFSPIVIKLQTEPEKSPSQHILQRAVLSIFRLKNNGFQQKIIYQKRSYPVTKAKRLPNPICIPRKKQYCLRGMKGQNFPNNAKTYSMYKIAGWFCGGCLPQQPVIFRFTRVRKIGMPCRSHFNSHRNKENFLSSEYGFAGVIAVAG